MDKIVSSFYCQKCKEIPLIEIHPNINEVKILTSCCHKQFINSDIFLKNYYKQTININQIKEKKNTNNFNQSTNEKINQIIKNYNENKEKNEKGLFKVKEQAMNYIKKIIEKIEFIYELNRKINNEIDKIIQILFNNYKLNINNDINKKNILLNTQLNNINNKLFNFYNIKDLNGFVKEINKYYESNYIIKPYKLKLIENFHYFNCQLFSEIKNDIFAFKLSDNLKIFNIKNSKKFLILELKKNIKSLLIDENKKYLFVLCNNCIKLFEINEIEKYLNEGKEIITNNCLYEFEEKNELLNLINLENNLLCGYNENNIFIYKYNIGKSFEIIKKLEIQIKNIIFIKRENKKFIGCIIDNYLTIFDVPDLIIKNKIEILKKIGIYNMEQISNDEIIIGINNILHIINLKSNKINVSKKINFYIMSIKQLRDKTILVGGRNELKRFGIKKLEELPDLISFDDDNYDEDNFILRSLHKDDNDINCIKEISNGRIFLILPNYIKIYEYNFD